MSQQLALDLELVESINVDSGLTSWEAEFVDSLLHQLKSARRPLTPRQRETAENLQRKLDERARDE